MDANEAEALLHVTTPATWAAARVAGGLRGAPFLHLCTQAQLPFVLSRHFHGRAGLLLLRIDPAGLDVRWEASEPGMDPFPHLYGPLPAAAITGTAPAGQP